MYTYILLLTGMVWSVWPLNAMRKSARACVVAFAVSSLFTTASACSPTPVPGGTGSEYVEAIKSVQGGECTVTSYTQHCASACDCGALITDAATGNVQTCKPLQCVLSSANCVGTTDTNIASRCTSTEIDPDGTSGAPRLPLHSHFDTCLDFQICGLPCTQMSAQQLAVMLTG